MKGFDTWLLAESEMHSLLAGCFQSYYDPTSFLVLADWFEEHGDPMGDFIRASVAHAAAPPGSPDHNTLAARINMPWRLVFKQLQAQRVHTERVHNDYLVRAPVPGGREIVQYRLIGNAVEIRRTRPIRWEPIAITDLPDAVAKMMLILRLREVWHGAGHENAANRVAVIQIRRCMAYLGRYFTHGHVGSPCPTIAENIDEIESLVRRLQFYLDQHPDLRIEQQDYDTTDWLLGRWNNRSLHGLITQCDLDREDIANRLRAVLERVREAF